MTNNQAIFLVYPNVAYIVGDKAYDSENNEIALDQSLIQAKIDSVVYAEKRALEYPSMTDYLDGVVKGDQAQIQAYIDACLAVKTKYPKA